MTSKNFARCFAFAFITFFITAGGYAQPSPQLWNWKPCVAISPLNNAETFALGNIRSDGATIDEGDDFLEFSSGVFPALCVMDQSYTTKFVHNVQGIGLQMGSSTDVAEEWAFWVDITLPSGKNIRLPKLQYDKHGANSRGNVNERIVVNLLLPIGTVIRIRRPAVVCLGMPDNMVVNPAYPADYHAYDQNNCITGQAVTLMGAP